LFARQSLYNHNPRASASFLLLFLQFFYATEGSTQKLQIENVLYLGDDGGIGCEVGILQKGTVVITSLTHIRVKISHPIGKEIRKYQNERINKLALQNIQREH
jgi:hypothetical protein